MVIRATEEELSAISGVGGVIAGTFVEYFKDTEGFGEKSYENLRKRIENARKTTLPRLIYSLGIPNIGISNAKMICRALGEDPKRVIRATEEEFGLS